MRRLPFKPSLLAICVFAAVLRLAAFAATGGFNHPETWESETIATNLVEGRGFTYPTLGVTYRSYMEPLYPAMCAAVYAVTNHSLPAVAIVQVLLGTALVVLVAACARHVLPPEGALIAALLTAVHPGVILYTTKFHPFVLDSVLWFATFAAVLAFSPAHPVRSAAVAGAFLGTAVLTRPTILACTPMFAWWLWRRSTDHARARFSRLLLLGVCAAAIVAPWMWRNYAIHHRMMLTRSGTSFVLWLGNNPYLFTGSAMTPNGENVIDKVPPAVRGELERLDEMGQQDYFAREVRAYIRRDPRGFALRWLRKLGYFWWFSPQAGALYPRTLFRVYQCIEAAILGLAAFGTWLLWRSAAETIRRDAIVFFLACAAAISVLQSVYYVEGRHRLAIEGLLLIFAAAGIAAVTRARRT
jgi:hypothetical protein